MRHVAPETSYASLSPALLASVPEQLRDPVEDFLAVVLRVTSAAPATVANDEHSESVLLPKGTVEGARAALQEALGALLASGAPPKT